MSKKKSSEQTPGAFSHHPFRALTGFTPRASVKKEGPEKKRPAPSAVDEGDDADLFLRAIGDVKKPGPAGLGRKKQPLDSPGRKDREDEDLALFLRAIRTMGPAPAAPAEEDVPPVARFASSGRMKMLTRGAIRIEDQLDLHGFAREEALRLLGRFIAGSCGRGLPAVLVITGKGKNSPEGPVLQGAGAAWLKEAGKGLVAEFAPAPRDKGGSGAFVVFLKGKRRGR